MKRIITCSDGTWNKPNDNYKGVLVRTNVQKIFEAIAKSDGSISQVKFYDEGIGSEGTWYSKIIDGATGKGIDDNILSAYKFIVWNYEPGDEIYLFGFSRGAYTARSLAGFIRNCGILKNNDLGLIKQAYDIYRDRTKATHPDSKLAINFKNQYSYTPRIKFIGVWETVGSLGIPSRFFQWYNKLKYQFHDTTLSSIVEFAYQALAIDEKRKNFKPTFWDQSDKIRNGILKQVMEQRWFAGVHSNVGGGYPDEGLSDLALSWIIEKSISPELGLHFDKDFLANEIKPNYKSELYNSDHFPFNLISPYVRPINCNNQRVDDSAKLRYNSVESYKPANLIKYIKDNPLG